MRRFFIALVILAFVSFNSTLLASYAYYVGKNHTSDNTVLIGGTGEEVSGHWLEVVPQRLHEPGSKIKVGVNEKANYPGKITEIPQSAKTHRYLGMFYSDYLGFPAPLINGGLNEHGVAARDVWATSRSELRKMTVTPQTGPSYSDLSRIAMERATSAKEAARIVGELIDRYGYSTYGGNSHLFADADEGWVLIEMAGSKGLWVAERLGPDDVRVLYPGYIGDIPKNYLKNPNYMGSKNLISFAIEQGWYDPDSNRPFNVAEVYLSQPEGGSYKFVTPRMIEKEFLNMSPDVSVRDMMAMVRDPRICDEEAGYGQVARLVKRKNGICHLLWIAPTGSVTAPFIPYRVGVSEVPPEFGQHRYLYKDAGRKFLTTEFQSQEATLFAGRLFKRLLYHTSENPEIFLEDVQNSLIEFEDKLFGEQKDVEATIQALIKSGNEELAVKYMTFYSNTRAKDALELGSILVDYVEARTRLKKGIRRPGSRKINSDGGTTPNCLIGHDPDQSEH